VRDLTSYPGTRGTHRFVKDLTSYPGTMATRHRARRDAGRDEDFKADIDSEAAPEDGWLEFVVSHSSTVKLWMNGALGIQGFNDRATCRRMHDPVPEVGKWLKSVVSGHIRYFGVPGNRYALAHFRFTVSYLWHHALERRSQKGRVQWERMQLSRSRKFGQPDKWKLCSPAA